MTTATSGVLASLRFPWPLLPVRNLLRVTGPQCVTGTRSAALKGTLTGNPPIPHLKRNLLFEKLAQKKPIQACKFRFLEQEIADPPVEAHSATGFDLAAHFALWSHQPLCPHMPSHLFPHHALLLRFVSLQRSTLISAAP
jgi:hypothetical protein